ncbi:hypothetical protein Y032_0266g717 [Ancylostoma ceylanicum]|uniref:Uncharacterized protein n=2 Tax=Ancylostoma ceylanicum TaxID=53326 RepID=A0A016SA23_9BILA|nr:hypothetical protein Y032_0266g717 [Ancylostoma ceylanicum]
METPKTSHISVAPACKSRALQTLKTPNGSGKQVATQCDTAPTNGKRRRGRPRKDSPPRNSDNGRNGCVSRPSCIRYSYPIPEPPNARNQCKAENRSTKSNGETGRCSQKRSVSPSSFTQTAKTVKRSRKRSAPSPSPSDIIKVVDYSPKRSPPSLSASNFLILWCAVLRYVGLFFSLEEERSAAGVSSGYGNVGRSRHEGPPIAAIQRKRYLVEMFDSMLPTEICDGRVDLQELVNKMSRFLADLLDSAGLWDFQGRRDIDHNHHYMAEPSRALAPTSQIAFENLLTPTRRSYNLPYQPQNSSSNGGHLLDNVRMISEGREENYGLGAFQDANIRALLPNTPVYSAARLRNLVHSNGTAMTERENTEIVPVEKLDPHQLQLLQEKGFRLVTLDVPEDRRSLTNMQRMALADMCDENTTEKPKSMKY